MEKKRHTYDMGLIGNCNYIGAIGVNADIRWLCWPKFDSSFVFGPLMDRAKGGEFSIAPVGEYETEQHYISGTNILETVFKAKDGRFKVVDFAPRYRVEDENVRPLKLVRQIILLEGLPEITVTCRPVYDYGESTFECTWKDDCLHFQSGETQLFLTGEKLSEICEKKSFKLEAGITLTLSYAEKMDSDQIEYEQTMAYWHDWLGRGNYPEFQREAVQRSALVLKLHQYETTGAVIASSTTSLPEHPGSGRNWDYRYCWFRDAWFTLDALDSLGYKREWSHFVNFITGILDKETDHIQPLYSIEGRNEILESEYPLEGYLGEQPVRIGNDAWRQIQNDVYGQLILSMRSLYLNEDKRMPSLEYLKKVLRFSHQHLVEEDAGIWEYRNLSGTHTESLLFHYLGAKSCLAIADKFKDGELHELADSLLEKSKVEIEKCFDPELKCYGVSQESPKIHNASEYLLLTLGYLSPENPVSRTHIKALGDSLKASDHLIYRYRNTDDFGVTKGTFLICAFWRLESLALLGDLDVAKEGFKSLLSTANHLGILSEDVDAKDISQWGNFAQTYSHVGLIKTALSLDKV